MFTSVCHQCNQVQPSLGGLFIQGECRSAADVGILLEARDTGSEATITTTAAAVPAHESEATCRPREAVMTHIASEDKLHQHEPDPAPVSPDVYRDQQAILQNQSSSIPKSHSPQIASNDLEDDQRADLEPVIPDVSTEQQTTVNSPCNHNPKSPSSEENMDRGTDDDDHATVTVDKVQLQMNKAIAAAVAAAAISAVVESHAAAERAALIEGAHEYHAVHERQCQQKEAEILDTAVAHVRCRIAAMQVARHWKTWRCSPAWHKRVSAATCIQAHSRGYLLRLELPKIQHTVSCEKKV